ncbi:hypothetical protein [Nocardioides sp. Root151]|uniref:hypothetical protein n=1 Tax=Nocardioides sp. Root151 TaxID=1736475 RepID=UPI000B3370A1|nr:hypothetical protein [Nocardioides sp. Root151]
MNRGRPLAWLAALASVVGLLAACGNESDTDANPAGQVQVDRAEPDSDLPDSPFGRLLSWSAPTADRVWAVTTAEKTCASCAALWSYAPGSTRGWKRVHTFAEPAEAGQDDGYGPFPPVSATSLVMAPDGLHGWFRWDTDGILATEDGGRSWRHLPSPQDADERATGEIAVHEDHLYLVLLAQCESDECPNTVWRTGLDASDWTEVTPEGSEGIFELSASDAGLWAEDLGTGAVHTSRDGADWERTPLGRFGGLCLPADGTPDVLAAACQTSDQGEPGGEVEVSEDRGRTWRTIHTTPRNVEAVVAGPKGHFLVLAGGQGVLISDGTTSKVPSTGGLHEWSGRFIDEQTIYLGGPRGLFATRDGGRTWDNLISKKRVG